MVTTEQNRNGSWTVTALVADGKSCGEWFRSVTYYDYTKKEAIAKYLQDYGKEIVDNGEEDW
jgi:hypothetical protein